ncbi:MAG TPA: hypothetical protein VLH38_00075 [Patescibacteria group bacterium]|nr:hypothetical protein [Patescibacteria group bacterium]
MIDSEHPHDQTHGKRDKQRSDNCVYPYRSVLAKEMNARRDKGEKIDEWINPRVDVTHLLEGIDGPIIEVAGPTEIGHYYLDGVQLSSPPIITNRARGTLRAEVGGTEGPDRLEGLLDVENLDLEDESVGMIIAAHLPTINEDDFNFSNFTDADNAEYGRRQDLAEKEINDFVASEHKELPHTSLRLKAAQEIYRCLKPGGVYLADGSAAERAAYERMGFKVVAGLNSEPDAETPYYYMVLQKIDVH